MEQCGAGAGVAALEAVGAQQAADAVVILFVALDGVDMCVDAGLDPSHVAVLGRSSQVFGKGGDRDVIGQLGGFHGANLVDEK